MPARGYEFYLRVVRYRVVLYKLSYDDVIDYFPKISDHFPEISEHFPKFCRRPDERFRTFSEDDRGLPKIAKEEPIMFRSYSKTSGYSLRDYVAKAMVIMLSSPVKICYLQVWRYEVFAGKLTWYFTGVSIINFTLTVRLTTQVYKYHKWVPANLLLGGRECDGLASHPEESSLLHTETGNKRR